MADRLMSVKFDDETIDQLRELVGIHDTNLAEEVRRAVRQYIDRSKNGDV